MNPRFFVLIVAAIAVLCFSGTASTKTLPVKPSEILVPQTTFEVSAARQARHLRSEIRWHRAMAWHWQDVAQTPRTPSSYSERHEFSVPYLQWDKKIWVAKRAIAKKKALAYLKRQAAVRRGTFVVGYGSGLPPHAAGWICIHTQEGAWNSATGNGYYGGLQMTYGWMGLVQNASLLSATQQMWAAETGYERSGHSHSWLAGQWPNTYPPCAGHF